MSWYGLRLSTATISKDEKKKSGRIGGYCGLTFKCKAESAPPASRKSTICHGIRVLDSQGELSSKISHVLVLFDLKIKEGTSRSIEIAN